MFKKWFQTNSKDQMQIKKQFKFSTHADEAVCYTKCRYGCGKFRSISVVPIIMLASLPFAIVLPTDTSIIFGEKTLYIQPERPRHLDWLHELEEDNKRHIAVESMDYDLCCFPFLRVTSKSLKSKK